PRDLFQGRAYRVDLAELLGGDLTDPGAAVGPGLHEAQRLQLAQRLTDGSLAGPELDGDLALDDAVAGTVGAVEDALDEAILDLVAQRRPVEGRIHPRPLAPSRSCPYPYPFVR